MTNSTPRVYRWSPHPMSHYIRPGSPNENLKELTPTEWNLAWVALPDPATTPAPENFVRVVRSSLPCVGSVGNLVLSMKQMLGSTAPGFPSLVANTKWHQQPPILSLDKDWLDRWKERVKQARVDHPSTLTQAMDRQVTDTSAAQNLLRGKGWANTFQS